MTKLVPYDEKKWGGVLASDYITFCGRGRDEKFSSGRIVEVLVLPNNDRYEHGKGMGLQQIQRSIHICYNILCRSETAKVDFCLPHPQPF